MKRLIDLDELLQYPLRRGSEHYDEKNADLHFLFGVESVLEYAQTLPTLTQPNNWISVEDRLPDENTRVLVFIPYTDTKIDTDRILNGKWVRWIDKITHWQPLPEPPEED